MKSFVFKIIINYNHKCSGFINFKIFLLFRFFFPYKIYNFLQKIFKNSNFIIFLLPEFWKFV